MKIRILALTLFVAVNGICAQPHHFQKTNNIFLSVSGGPSFQSITDRFGYETYQLSGTGLQLDVAAGFALSQNFFMHFTFITSRLADPTIKVPNMYSPRPSDEVAMKDRMVGGGLTWYPIKELFFSFSAGPGIMKFIDKEDPENSDSTDRGPAFQLKAGREWQITPKWGMGVCLTYGKTITKNLTNNGEEELNSNRIGFLCSISMH
jgi:hypothetical protein